jgi:predicted small lipoprotein YifL
VIHIFNLKPDAMKTFLSSLVLIILFLGTAVGQKCTLYFPDEEGTEMVTKNFNQKDKLTGTVVQKITSKDIEGDNVTMNIDHSSYDKKDKLIMDGSYEVRCVDGVFYLDMRNMLDEAALSTYENMEVEVDANDMAFPAVLSEGQSLPDASITVKVNSSGVTVMTMTVFVNNRKVESKEMITTPAGSFDCYKISSDIESKMIIKAQVQSIQWISEDFGVIQTKSYDKKGKLQGYSVLHKITRP